jgi:isopenicillin-N epimerase
MITPDARALFPIDSAVAYLDHGGFGVVPLEVANAQRECRERIERNPKAFFAYRWPEEWNAAIEAVAIRFGVDARNIAFVENASDGVNAVLRSLSFGEGDEILVTSQTYGAVEIAAREIARRSKAVVTRANLPFPVVEPSDYPGILARAINARTRLAILDHIASPTSLVMPIRQMVAACRQRGVAVLVDAAHAPGHVPLDIRDIGADWYVGNLHKWYFAPRPLAFLWADNARLEQTRPSILSWNAQDAYCFRFNWTGTRDVSQIMAAPQAFRFMDRFGEVNVIRHNRELIREALGILSQMWKIRNTTPETMIGCMATLPLPAGLPFPANDQGCAALQKALILEKGVSVAVPLAVDGEHFIRIAAQIYNDRADYVKLGEAVLSLR